MAHMDRLKEASVSNRRIGTVQPVFVDACHKTALRDNFGSQILVLAAAILKAKIAHSANIGMWLLAVASARR